MTSAQPSPARRFPNQDASAQQPVGQTQHRDATAENARAARLIRLATYASISTAATLIVVKLAAWMATGSVAVLSSLIDSLMDAAASLVNLIAVRQSLAPAARPDRLRPTSSYKVATFLVRSAGFVFRGGPLADQGPMAS